MRETNKIKPCELCGLVLNLVNWGGGGNIWCEHDETLYPKAQRMHDTERCLKQRLATAESRIEEHLSFVNVAVPFLTGQLDRYPTESLRRIVSRGLSLLSLAHLTRATKDENMTPQKVETTLVAPGIEMTHAKRYQLFTMGQKVQRVTGEGSVVDDVREEIELNLRGIGTIIGTYVDKPSEGLEVLWLWVAWEHCPPGSYEPEALRLV